ncbi:MAG: hypothetical protein ACTSRZ_06785 [Promethearchaeota archaeon]
MKNKLSKSTLLFAILIVGIIIPAIPVAKADSTVLQDGFNFSYDSQNPQEIAAMPTGMANTLAEIFGAMKFLGPSGAALGESFRLLFKQLENITELDTSLMQGLYMISANHTDEYYKWSDSYQNRKETYWLYQKDYQGVVGPNEYPYIEVVRSGTVNVTYTAGASIVFILWDYDESLITAINRVITAYRNVQALIETLPEDPNQWDNNQAEQVYTAIVNEIVQAVIYLIFHINDIINGDELFITNINTWETWNVSTSPDFSTTVTAKKWTSSGSVVLNPTERANLEAAALANGDEYAYYLLTQAESEDGVISKDWSHFTFNLVELWLKNFEIHINASAIVDALIYETSGGSEGSPFDEETTVAKIFQGLDIDLYLITHSLFAFVAYDDTIVPDGVPSVQWADVNESGVEYQVITDTEVQYWFALKDFSAPTFNKPQLINTANGPGLQWSIRLNNVNLVPIPVGLTPGDMSPLPPAENLEYIEMGFTFTPVRELEVDTSEYDDVSNAETEVKMGAGIIKLDQSFGTWNGGAGVVNDGASNEMDLTGLDFAVIFVSTMLHFHVHIDVSDVDTSFGEAGLAGTKGLVNESNYNVDGTIKVGNDKGTLPLAAIDIAGPDYQQGNPPSSYPAKTTLIPLAFFGLNLGAHVQYIDDQNPNASFKADGFLEIQTSIVLYAVAYPTWDGSGDQLIHDPTFSIFMTWENPGFWAVILVVGSVTLVAVAAILITKKKNRE